MLNEAVTNAMKYAFDTSKKNSISICLNKEENNDIILIVNDNGKGLPPGFQPSQSTTLGLNLINGLCKQIKAKCSIESNHGVCISIRFRNPFDTVGVLDEAVLENN
jgi:two-component sensor histidine kinase